MYQSNNFHSYFLSCKSRQFILLFSSHLCFLGFAIFFLFVFTLTLLLLAAVISLSFLVFMYFSSLRIVALIFSLPTSLPWVVLWDATLAGRQATSWRSRDWSFSFGHKLGLIEDLTLTLPVSHVGICKYHFITPTHFYLLFLTYRI